MASFEDYERAYVLFIVPAKVIILGRTCVLDDNQRLGVWSGKRIFIKEFFVFVVLCVVVFLSEIPFLSSL